MKKWFEGGRTYIHFATLFDAVVVAGKRELLEELKRYIFSSGRNDTLYLAYFARLSLLFETPVGTLQLRYYVEIDLLI